MSLLNENIETLAICAMLTMLASLLTVVLSVICGAALAFHARPTLRYGVALAILFVPFAIGGSVWAYSVTLLASASGIKKELVSSGTLSRASFLLILCLARSVPLGTFFCVTTLQRYTAEIRPYFQIHQLQFPFIFLCGLNRIPKSILTLLGLFGGALMASETSLPTFLYRANPGTGPETVNIMLFRLFRESYASSAPESLSRVATLGVVVSLLLLISALIGALVAGVVLFLFRSFLQRSNLLAGTSAVVFTILPRLAMLFAFVPGIAALAALFVPGRVTGMVHTDPIGRLLDCRDIVTLGIVIAGTITAVSIAMAVRLRYAQRDLLAVLESKPMAACVLLLPAFLPVLSVVALLGKFTNGRIAGVSGYLAFFISHFALHYPIFQFICVTLIAAIPERHVAWQRSMKLRYSFSLMTDGFGRHIAVIISLIGLGTVQIVTDGSISRWFSHLVKAPEESLHASLLGRLASAADAAAITWSVAVIATTVCAVLSAAYVRELRKCQRYA